MQGRIMLVDPNETNLKMLRVCLEQMAPELEIVGQATDAEEALRTVIESQPDVVLLDFDLPRLTGIETAWWIMRAAPRARVILRSEYDEPWIRQRSVQLGIFGLLRKDEPLTGLHRMVAQALQAPPQRACFSGISAACTRPAREFST